MPWTVADVDRHKKGLTSDAKRRWVAVANAVLSRCKGPASECEGKAIRMANGVVRRKAVWTTASVNSLPDSSFLWIEPGGKKDSEGKTVPRGKRHFPYKDASGKVDLPHLRNAIARIPQSNAPGVPKEALQARARRLLQSAGKARQGKKPSMRSHGMGAGQADEMHGVPGEVGSETGGRKKKPRRKKPVAVARHKAQLTVFKDTNGEYRWVLYSSNPYKDSDEEFVTQKAHEGDIQRIDETGEYGPLRWWHKGEPYFDDVTNWTTVHPGPGLDLGTCDFAAMHGRIRVESGTFKSAKIGRAFAAHADELEGSIAFSHPPDQPDDGGGFLDIITFERSLTPTDRASNLFTRLLVQSKEQPMDTDKLKALKELGVDIDSVLEGAELIQKKADKSAPFRMKASSRAAAVEEEEDEDTALAAKLDKLTEQIASMQAAMKDDADPEPEERLEDLLVGELTVAELQDVVGSVISAKSANPTGAGLQLILEELTEIKGILTSKSVQSVVEEVGRMKAKLERLSARTKGVAGKLRELDDAQPRMIQRGVRPSASDDTLLDLEDTADISSKSANNPFSWINDFVEKNG